LFERGVVFCVLYLIVVPLLRGKSPFAVQLNNNNMKFYVERDGSEAVIQQL
jgi:hypothetical protein